MRQIGLTGLLKIELPDYTIRFCDGGFFQHDGETYRGLDALFGTIGGIQALSEGVGDSVPALNLSLLPPSSSAAATLSRPGYQTSRVRFYIAEFDAETGLIISADIQFDGQVDQTILNFGRGTRELAMSIVSLAERLFEGDIGNTLNPTWHKSIHPGETGHDNATGLSVPVAWGIESQGGSGGSSFGSANNGGSTQPNNNLRIY